MKKYLTLLMLPILFACSDDEGKVYDVNLEVIEKGSIYHRTVKNDNDKYDNRFYASVVNSSNKDVAGYVRFEIKGYGSINSERGIVPGEKGHQNTFFISLETTEPINESYLLSTQFIRE